MKPDQIAKLISEDIRINNGLLFEEIIQVPQELIDLIVPVFKKNAGWPVVSISKMEVDRNSGNRCKIYIDCSNPETQKRREMERQEGIPSRNEDDQGYYNFILGISPNVGIATDDYAKPTKFLDRETEYAIVDLVRKIIGHKEIDNYQGGLMNFDREKTKYQKQFPDKKPSPPPNYGVPKPPLDSEGYW